MFTAVAVIVAASLGLICGVVGLVMAIMTSIELKAMQKSTHKIQYVPIEEPETVGSDELPVEKIQIEPDYSEVDKELLKEIDEEDSLFFAE